LEAIPDLMNLERNFQFGSSENVDVFLWLMAQVLLGLSAGTIDLQSFISEVPVADRHYRVFNVTVLLTQGLMFVAFWSALVGRGIALIRGRSKA
jgi:hypothetical protein